MRAIAYVRCSTGEQADSGLGLDAQRNRIAAYCQMRGITLVEVITDAGVSASKPLGNRVGGQELAHALKRSGAGAVIVLRLDRAFRSVTDCLKSVDTWRKRGVALHIVDLGGNSIDTESASGRFMMTILAGAAEMERNLIGERTRAALAVLKANGKRTGTVAFGFDLADDGKTLVENGHEQATLGEIAGLRAEGKTLASIAKHLTDRGIPTKSGNQSWSIASVARIVKRLEAEGAIAK